MSSHHHTSTRSPIERRARRRVAIKAGLFVHTLVYVLVNSGLYLLWTLNAATSSTGAARSAGLPLAGWALGLGIHAIVVVVLLTGESLMRRLIEREVQALSSTAN